MGEDPLPAELNDCFEVLFALEHERDRGQDVYEAIFSHPLLFPLQRRREMSFMMQEARRIQPRVVCEIGADKGGGLYHWCKSLITVERVVACEIRGTPYSRLFAKAFPEIDFLWIPDSSYEPRSLRVVSDWLGKEKIDCLFIDGDKHAFDKDFWSYRPMLSDSGIVFMHDINDKPPLAGFNNVVKAGYRHKKHTDISESKEAMNRQEQGTPSKDVHEDWLRHWKGQSAGVGVIYLEEGK